MKPKHLGRLLGVATTAIAAVAMLVPAAQAATPAPGYEQFAGCPSPAEKETITSCFHAVIKSGHFKMGSKDVPIKNPMTLTGGLNKKGEEFSFNSEGGLSKVRQTVPGGVIGLTGLDWLVEFLNLEALELYAVTELAGQPGSPTAPVFTLPLKVHLINPVLGNNCYVGSNSNPINLNLTFGTTNPPPPAEPISGTPPKLVNDTVTHILHLNDGTMVDNAFSAPGASGCVLTLFGFIPVSINGLVNFQSGLPAEAGTNETTQTLDAESVASKFVYP